MGPAAGHSDVRMTAWQLELPGRSPVAAHGLTRVRELMFIG